MSNVNLMHGNCLKRMSEIPDGSVDMILADLPYGTTACKWDVLIPFKPLWKHYWRVIKSNGAVVLFGSEPFSSKLRQSSFKYFKYDWVWLKSRATGHVHAKNKPMKIHETISVFSKGVTVHSSQTNKRLSYFPQDLKLLSEPKLRRKSGAVNTVMGARPSHKDTFQQYTNYPTSVLSFPSGNVGFHPTQKPVPLLEYLIRTYTNEGETVLDNVMGSGSTGVACLNTNRKFIGIEKDDAYFEIAKNRIGESLG